VQGFTPWPKTSTASGTIWDVERSHPVPSHHWRLQVSQGFWRQLGYLRSSLMALDNEVSANKLRSSSFCPFNHVLNGYFNCRNYWETFNFSCLSDWQAGSYFGNSAVENKICPWWKVQVTASSSWPKDLPLRSIEVGCFNHGTNILSWVQLG